MSKIKMLGSTRQGQDPYPVVVHNSSRFLLNSAIIGAEIILARREFNNAVKKVVSY